MVTVWDFPTCVLVIILHGSVCPWTQQCLKQEVLAVLVSLCARKLAVPESAGHAVCCLCEAGCQGLSVSLAGDIIEGCIGAMQRTVPCHPRLSGLLEHPHYMAALGSVQGGSPKRGSGERASWLFFP